MIKLFHRSSRKAQRTGFLGELPILLVMLQRDRHSLVHSLKEGHVGLRTSVSHDFPFSVACRTLYPSFDEVMSCTTDIVNQMGLGPPGTTKPLCAAISRLTFADPYRCLEGKERKILFGLLYCVNAE